MAPTQVAGKVNRGNVIHRQSGLRLDPKTKVTPIAPGGQVINADRFKFIPR